MNNAIDVDDVVDEVDVDVDENVDDVNEDAADDDDLIVE